MQEKVNKYFRLWLLFSVLMTAAIFIAGQFYQHGPFLPDQGPLWYYWQLPVADNMARLTGWAGFLLHLLVTLGLIWKIKQLKTPEFSKWHVWLFFSQILFSILHLVQTFIWYDALVRDFPVWLSQFAVIIMLVLMLIIMNRKRGLFFGWKLPVPAQVTKYFIDIHGLFIILALIFTFWYHPMDPSVGHLIGFFYMFMLLGQIVFSNTHMHFHNVWVFLLEFTVLLHGTAIAMQSLNIPATSAPKVIWPMFAFGFAAVTLITHIYSLKLPKSVVWASYILYALLVALIYSGALLGVRSLEQLPEISYIPLILYLLVFVFTAIALLVWKLKQPRGAVKNVELKAG